MRSIGHPAARLTILLGQDNVLRFLDLEIGRLESTHIERNACHNHICAHRSSSHSDTRGIFQANRAREICCSKKLAEDPEFMPGTLKTTVIRIGLFGDILPSLSV